MCDDVDGVTGSVFEYSFHHASNLHDIDLTVGVFISRHGLGNSIGRTVQLTRTVSVSQIARQSVGPPLKQSPECSIGIAVYKDYRGSLQAVFVVDESSKTSANQICTRETFILRMLLEP